MIKMLDARSLEEALSSTTDVILFVVPEQLQYIRYDKYTTFASDLASRVRQLLPRFSIFGIEEFMEAKIKSEINIDLFSGDRKFIEPLFIKRGDEILTLQIKIEKRSEIVKNSKKVLEFLEKKNNNKGEL